MWCDKLESIFTNKKYDKGVIMMQWQEVRTIYPDQYVLLEILDSHTEDNIQFVDE